MRNKRDSKHTRSIGARKFVGDFNALVAKHVAKELPMTDPKEFWSDSCWQEKPGKLG
jgi:hypothetical protein